MHQKKDAWPRKLWTRYRLLVRTGFNEFYRVKEVSDVFYKELKKLGIIDEPDRQAASAITREFLAPLVRVRNQITHKHMRIAEHERNAWRAVTIEEAGYLLYSEKTQETVQARLEVGLVASKIANEFDKTGQALFSALQEVFDETARHIVESSPEMNFKVSCS